MLEKETKHCKELQTMSSKTSRSAVSATEIEDLLERVCFHDCFRLFCFVWFLKKVLFVGFCKIVRKVAFFLVITKCRILLRSLINSNPRPFLQMFYP